MDISQMMALSLHIYLVCGLGSDLIFIWILQE